MSAERAISTVKRIVGARSKSEIGLARNAPGIAFRCGSCKWFDGDHCDNPNPKLHEKPVKPQWCCNLYDHTGMEVIV